MMLVIIVMETVAVMLIGLCSRSSDDGDGDSGNDADVSDRQ